MKRLLQAFIFGQRYHDDSLSILPSYDQRSAAVADAVQVLFQILAKLRVRNVAHWRLLSYRKLYVTRPVSTTKSRDLVDRDFVGDAAQCTALRYRFEPAGFEQGGGLRVRHDGAGRQDRARIRETLDSRGDVDGGPEIVLPIVEHDRQARPFMDADLQQ